MVPPVPAPITQCVTQAVSVTPDFRAGGLVVAARGRRIGKLVRLVGTGDFRDEPVRDTVVALRAVGRHGRWRDHYFGAISLKHGALVFAHLVRHHEDALVALLLGHQRQPYTGIARRRLNDGAAGQQCAGPFGLFDHFHRDTVLDGAARIDVFQFDQDRGFDAFRHVVELDERRVSDEVQDGLRVLHRYKVTVSWPVHQMMARCAGFGAKIMR